MSKQEIERYFPNLLNCGYSITSPETSECNCIAWAAEDSEAWWWPDQNSQYFWPSGIPRIESVEAFIKAYGLLGYASCYDAGYEEGYEKIAIYIDSSGKPTHAARQLSSEKWTSKLGNLEDIEHERLEGIAGQQYGTVATIMKRPKKS